MKSPLAWPVLSSPFLLGSAQLPKEFAGAEGGLIARKASDGDVQAEKERLERRFTDASNNLQTLREEVGPLRSEVTSKKAREEELKAKAKDDELKIKELEEKVAQFESGSIVNQNIIDAVMN